MTMRAAHIAYRFVEMSVSIVSRTFNAAVLGGSTHQTTSARMHIEGWPRGKRIVNSFFPWEDDHCAKAWEIEVYHAKRTLEKAGI